MSKTTQTAPADDTAAPADTAAAEITQAADAVAASLTATSEELAETIKANEELTKRVEALTELSNSLSDEKNALLLQVQEANERADRELARAADVSLALAQSEEHNEKLTSELQSARPVLSDNDIHARWIEAGGTHAQAEAAKRFAAALLA